MKLFATGLLVFAAVVFVVARTFEDEATWVGYVESAAEAAMVGALADWFAVTALFRYPLGIPIPHTAIIPNRKDDIGRSLGDFVQGNFLTPDVIGERLAGAQDRRAPRSTGWPSRPTPSAPARRPPTPSAASSRCSTTATSRRRSARPSRSGWRGPRWPRCSARRSTWRSTAATTSGCSTA